MTDKSEVGTAAWTDEGFQISATLLRDGTWVVDPPWLAPLADVLAITYGGPEWVSTPADGVPGAKKLYDLAARHGGTVCLAQPPIDTPDEVVH